MTIISDLKYTRNNIFKAINDKFRDLITLLDEDKKKFYVNGESVELQNHCLTLKRELSKKM